MKGTPELPMCGFSRAVIQVMQVQGVKPELLKTFNCLEDQELREGIKEYSDWPTIPQVYVGGEFVGGCDIVINSKWNVRGSQRRRRRWRSDTTAPVVGGQRSSSGGWWRK